MVTHDMEEYRQFTGPQELHKAVNMLRGMVAGISIDGTLSDAETLELNHWCSLHANLRNRHPFTELIPAVERALMDGVIDPEEKANILWLCRNIEEPVPYYDLVTSAIQYLNGLVHGILADGDLSDDEIRALRGWLDDTEALAGTYPFDELNSLTAAILSDGKISEDERKTLMAFLGTIVEFKDSYNLSENEFKALRDQYSVKGICAFCPEIEFEGKVFAFTGESYRAKRAEIFADIEQLGGIPRSGVTKKTDYLIVGNAGNPCWAYACYGRKIEEAIQLRKEGTKVQIINETDFWDAAMDAGIE